MPRALVVLFCLLFASSALPAAVLMKTPDGTAISAERYGQGERGVILIHGQGRDRTDWAPFATELSGMDFQVVAVDLRGHGSSSGPDTLDESDYGAMVQEVAAAAVWLRSHGATSVTVIGARLGASLALHAGAADPEIANIVLLSPGLNIHGFKVSAALASYGARPMLLVASSTDTSGARAAEAISKNAQGDADFELLDDAGVGVRMLNRSPDLEGLIISWLTGTFRINKGEGASRVDLLTGDLSEIETTGHTLE